GYNAAQSKTNVRCITYELRESPSTPLCKLTGLFIPTPDNDVDAPCFLGSKNDAGSAKVGENKSKYNGQDALLMIMRKGTQQEEVAAKELEDEWALSKQHSEQEVSIGRFPQRKEVCVRECMCGGRVDVTPFVFLDLFVSRPMGRFLTGVALVEPSSGIKRQKESQALSHYAGPPLPALIESSDPKLMRRGAGAHLLSTADVLQRQTGERR
ncbi:hypothetical protein KUCAC02_017350, partial [Chaenocephalus aceratus]